MNKNYVVSVILIGVLLALAVNIMVTVQNAGNLGHQISIVCTEHRELARIAKEEAEEGAAAQIVTARINIPGLTHAELIELTNKKQARKEHRAVELQTISNHTC